MLAEVAPFWDMLIPFIAALILKFWAETFKPLTFTVV